MKMRALGIIATLVAVTAGIVVLAGLSSRPRGETISLRNDIRNVVVIYAENRSFDNLFSDYPGADGDGSAASIAPQIDRDASGKPLPKLPRTWGGVTVAGQNVTVTEAQSDNLPNTPYVLERTYEGLTRATVTRDLYHLFFENQMQIDGGKNDRFAAWSDAGGLALGHFDYRGSKLWQLAHEGVLADNFFQGAFGGSFLNHQYLICACVPSYPKELVARLKPAIAVLDLTAPVKPQLQVRPACEPGVAVTRTQSNCSPISALDGPPAYVLSGYLAPEDYFGPGDGLRAINTMVPPFQPSSIAPAADDATHLYSNPDSPSVLPPQSALTIADLLEARHISWAWYAGGWNQALTLTTAASYSRPQSPGPGHPAPVAPSFQFHHQPFNYYRKFDPGTDAGRAERAAHLQDYTDLIAAAASGQLPQVSFYKPEGDLNQHPGYTNVANFDEHVAEVVARLKASPQYPHMLIVITYDEFGGQWDHVAPPKGDLIGPGTRIPAIILSPYARAGTVDHTQYDTGSILRFIIRLFDLPPLAGLQHRDQRLRAGHSPLMGDLTPALDLHRSP